MWKNLNFLTFVAHDAVTSCGFRLWATTIAIDFGQVRLGWHLSIEVDSGLERIWLTLSIILRHKYLRLASRSRIDISSSGVRSTCGVPPRLLVSLHEAAAPV